MPSFRTKSGAKAFLAKAFAQGGKNTIKAVEKVEKDAVKTVVEDVYTPEEYQRTENLKNSIEGVVTKTTNNVVEMETRHNELVTQHTSETGQTITSDFPGIIINGAFPLFGDGPWTERRDYLEYTKKKIKEEDTVRKQMQIELKKQGIQSKL